MFKWPASDVAAAAVTVSNVPEDGWGLTFVLSTDENI